jgi:hypothetical protein
MLRRSRKGALLLVAAGSLLGSTLFLVQNQASSAPVASGIPGATHTGRVAPHVVKAAVRNSPVVPTRAQAQARNKVMAEYYALKAPVSPKHTTKAEVSAGNPGPQTKVAGAAPQTYAPTAFTVLKKSNIPGECATDCGQSSVNEPSVATAGHSVMEASNWDIAYSTTNTSTWSYQDPYTLFGSGYCCDSEIRYDANRDSFFWSGTYYSGNGNTSNRVVIASASSTSPTSWCSYTFYPNAFGGALGDTMDYPKITLGNNDLYLTWNEYNTTGGWYQTGLARLDLNAMAACQSVGYTYLNRTDVFTFDMAGNSGPKDTFYWTANWYISGGTSGSQMTIYTWAENSGTYFSNQRTINAYNFTIASCAWCGRLDPRSVSVAISHGGEFRNFGDDFLEAAIDAGPSGFDAHNYVVYEYFQLHSLTYEGSDQTFNSAYDFGYPSCASNTEGYIGCAMVDGAATGDAPGGFILLQDNTSPTQPWNYDYVVPGNKSNQSWGDYVVVNPVQPAPGPFETVLWKLSATAVVPYYVVWGRGHDVAGYNRWDTK